MDHSALYVRHNNTQPKNINVPMIVHFVWCLRSGFRFNNYLSVLSVIKHLDPDKLIFHYSALPKVDFFNYNTWFDTLSDNIAVLTLSTFAHAGVCNSTDTKRIFIGEILNDVGGIYVEETTVFTRNMEHLYDADEVIVKLGVDGGGYIAASERALTSGNIPIDRTQIFCPSFETVVSGSPCFTIRKRVHPKTFWNKSDYSSKIVNQLLYKTDMKPEPKRFTNAVIPNIAHVLWIDGRNVDFMFYLSCMSLMHVAEVDSLFVHGNMEPTGKYWQQLRQNNKITFIKIVLPDQIFNNTIKRRSHISDVFRARTLWKYGGIYSDVDVVWTQPISKHLFNYEAVASFDWANAYYPFPNYINLGVSMGKQGAPFWKKMVESMKDFRDDIFGYNGLLKPYKIYEEHPELLFVYDQLQVMCFKTKCHPGWNTTEDNINWQHDTFAYHWTWPTPTEFHNKSTLIKSNSVWAEIGRNVLMKAGIL